ncbi:MAG: DHH family phosphoesterase [Methanobacteriota archaeon]
MTLDERFREAARLLRDASFVRVVSHYDADGISAAGVLTRMLARLGVAFHATMRHQLDAPFFQRLAAEKNDLVLFSDLGSSSIEEIEALPGRSVILDHHVPLRPARRASCLQVNAHIEGVNGTHEACAGTLAYGLAREVDEANRDLFPIALAGMIGDRQHVPAPSGYNLSLVIDAEAHSGLRRERGLLLSGPSLVDAVAGSLDPYFAGLSGRPAAARTFLTSLQVPVQAALHEMSREHEERVVSALMLKLLAQGASREAAEELVGVRYRIDAFGCGTGKELTDLLNACGRHDRMGVGLSLLHNDSAANREARALVASYNEKILSGLLRLEEGGAEPRTNIQVFRAEEANFAGTVAGLGMAFLLDQKRPTLGVAVKDGELKVSARATRALIARGVDLAAALREAAGAVGGAGGGHPIAAGATVLAEKEEAFLSRVDAVVGAQVA